VLDLHRASHARHISNIANFSVVDLTGIVEEFALGLPAQTR